MIIIGGLLLVPALYAWINIIASWDPYGNTKGLLVAVVNSDKGAKFQNIEINVGNEVVDKLRNNESIGWTFVNQNEAESGVKYGKYYASITIPEDFSSNLLSITTNGEAKKADLIYSVNEKIKPELKEFMNMISDIDNNLPQIGESIDNAYNGAVDMNKFIQ